MPINDNVHGYVVRSKSGSQGALRLGFKPPNEANYQPFCRTKNVKLNVMVLLNLIFMSQSLPRTADGISVRFPSQRQISQLTNCRVVLHNRMQGDKHTISDGKYAAREKLPRTIFRVVRYQ